MRILLPLVFFPEAKKFLYFRQIVNDVNIELIFFIEWHIQINTIWSKKVEKSFYPLSKTNIYISTKKDVHLFKKHEFCKPKSIHKSFVQCFHALEVSVPVRVTAICVVSFPLFSLANVSKLILVSAYTVSVISDVTIQSVNVTKVPICRFVCRNQHRTFYQLSTLLHYSVNKCKLPVRCHDVFNIIPSTCISINCAIVLLWCCCTECKCYFFTCMWGCLFQKAWGCLFQKTSLCFTN